MLTGGLAIWIQFLNKHLTIDGSYNINVLALVLYKSNILWLKNLKVSNLDALINYYSRIYKAKSLSKLLT